MFRGTYTALVTPFRDDQVDEDAFRSLIDAQIKGGVDGVVPVGTTGESATLDMHEHIEVIRRTVDMVNKRVPVIINSVA